MDILPSTTETDTSQDGDPQIVGLDDDQLDEVLNVLSSDTARRILSVIYTDAATPSDIRDQTGLSLQSISYHVTQLKEAGLIQIADIRYSEKGREMNVYAPADDPVIVFVGTEDRKSGLRKLFKRVFGAGLVLVAATAYVFVKTFGFSGGPPGSTAPTGGLLDVSFVAFFLGGLSVLLLVALWGIWTRKR